MSRMGLLDSISSRFFLHPQRAAELRGRHPGLLAEGAQELKRAHERHLRQLVEVDLRRATNRRTFVGSPPAGGSRGSRVKAPS